MMGDNISLAEWVQRQEIVGVFVHNSCKVTVSLNLHLPAFRSSEERWVLLPLLYYRLHLLKFPLPSLPSTHRAVFDVNLVPWLPGEQLFILLILWYVSLFIHVHKCVSMYIGYMLSIHAQTGQRYTLGNFLSYSPLSFFETWPATH